MLNKITQNLTIIIMLLGVGVIVWNNISLFKKIEINNPFDTQDTIEQAQYTEDPSGISNPAIQNDGEQTLIAAAQSSANETFSTLMQPIYFGPQKIYTKYETTENAIRLDLQVNRVGLQEDGQLETPENYEEGGWYFRSAKIGEKGNTIINAHYDTNYSTPAAFHQLKNLAEGDIVYVVDERNNEFEYQVEELLYVSIQDPDRLKIFDDSTTEAQLTLITCGGVWDSIAGTYDRRLVVKARLID